MGVRAPRAGGAALAVALVLAVACVRLAAAQLITNSAQLIVEQTASDTIITGTDVMLTNNPSERRQSPVWGHTAATAACN